LCESGDDELHQLVKESFTTENFGVKLTQTSIRSREDLRAEAILKETTKSIGHRYETGLLWKWSNFSLPESKSMAFMRLKCTERRMDKDASFAQQYNLKIAEYLTKGYVRKLSPEEAAVTTVRTFYLPHFGVTSPNKPGKFRLVFDAAAKAMGYSLNDFILSGPDLLQPLPEVLHKFREGRIAFTGDIADMFHRVAVREEDQDSQRFLWRGMERHQEPDVYVMQVMTFGATCSPCSATFCKEMMVVLRIIPQAPLDLTLFPYYTLTRVTHGLSPDPQGSWCLGVAVPFWGNKVKSTWDVCLQSRLFLN
jgi:hypothetical protein